MHFGKTHPVRKVPPWRQSLGLGLFSLAFRCEAFLCQSDPTWSKPGLKFHLVLQLLNEAFFLPTQRLKDIALQLSCWRGCCFRLLYRKYQWHLSRKLQLRNHSEHFHPLVQNSKSFPEGRHWHTRAGDNFFYTRSTWWDLPRNKDFTAESNMSLRNLESTVPILQEKGLTSNSLFKWHWLLVPFMPF